MPQLVFWPVVVDGDADVVFLYKLLYARESLRRGVAGDNDGDACAFAVLEFTPDIGIFILIEIDSSSGVKPDASSSVIGQRGRFLRQIHWQVIFDILRVQGKNVDLFHEGDELRAGEVAEGIAGQTQADWRFVTLRPRLLHLRNTSIGNCECGGCQCS